VTAQVIKPGDVGFCHSRGFIGTGIRLVQKLYGNSWATWNHVFIIDRCAPNDDFYVIQAVGKGVTNTALLSDISPGGNHVVVPMPTGCDREKALAYWRSQVGDKYGFLTDACIAVTLFTPKFLRVDLRRGGTVICSALGIFGLFAGGWPGVWGFKDYYQGLPAELFSCLRLQQ
jgi:hypothetical protein